MTFDPNSDLIWGLSVGQQGKISSGVFADIDKTTGTLCLKSAHTSKKLSLKPPVYNVYENISCEVKNVIYVINCRGCGDDYIGETGNFLSKRVKVHNQQSRIHKTRMLKESEHIDNCKKP